MRVLLVSQFYPPVVGGQERHVRNLGQALAERGHQVEVATIAIDGDEDTIFDGLVSVHRLRSSAQALPWLYSDPERPHALPTVDPRLRGGIARLLAAGSFDVLHAHDWSVNSALGPARRTGTPVVLTQHDYSQVCATKRLMRGEAVCPGPALLACARCASSKHGAISGPPIVLANFAASRARRRHVDTFVSVSTVVASSTGLVDSGRYEVIPNFIPDDLLLEEAVPHPDGPVVFVGDLSRDKGVEVLLEAYRRLSDPPRLVLAGRVLPDTSFDLPDHARLVGVLDYEAVIELLRTANIVVVPSIVPDCCPTVVLEAMAAGRPIIAAASGGIVDLVEDGVSGILVSPGDPGALSVALSSLIANQDSASAMGHKALDRVRPFTASVVVARIEDLYHRLIDGELVGQ